MVGVPLVFIFTYSYYSCNRKFSRTLDSKVVYLPSWTEGVSGSRRHTRPGAEIVCSPSLTQVSPGPSTPRETERVPRGVQPYSNSVITDPCATLFTTSRR